MSEGQQALDRRKAKASSRVETRRRMRLDYENIDYGNRRTEKLERATFFEAQTVRGGEKMKQEKEEEEATIDKTVGGTSLDKGNDGLASAQQTRAEASRRSRRRAVVQEVA